MPLPKPAPDEKEPDWLKRCMGDDMMVKEYEDSKQRYAICNNEWRQKDMKEKKLETVAIENIEIAAIGKWQGMANGKTAEINITAKDLEAMVEAFDELTADKKLNYEPPVKLGHDGKQKLLQEDGYPAAGWITSLKKVGDKLVATFREVPKKIAELINAGAYRKTSPEFYSDYAIGGKTYSRVLKAVAILGADIQAIKSTKDMVALYGSESMLDEEGVPFVTLLFEDSGEVTLDEIMSDLDTWLEKAEGKIHGKAGSPAIRTYLREVKSKLKALVGKEPKSDKLAEELNEKVTDAQAASETIVKNEQEVIMDKELRELLGLDEKADVLATVKALKEKAEAPVEVSLVEHQATESKVKALEFELAERERDELVGKEIRAGKLTPAQAKLPVILTLAEKDPSGFQALMASLPVVIEFGERGIPGGAPDEVQLTEAEIMVGEKMGVSKEDLLKAKQK